MFMVPCIVLYCEVDADVHGREVLVGIVKTADMPAPRLQCDMVYSHLQVCRCAHAHAIHTSNICACAWHMCMSVQVHVHVHGCMCVGAHVHRIVIAPS